jgi:hypothetical protein
MNSANSEKMVLVQVVPVDERREIGGCVAKTRHGRQ